MKAVKAHSTSTFDLTRTWLAARWYQTVHNLSSIPISDACVVSFLAYEDDTGAHWQVHFISAPESDCYEEDFDWTRARSPSATTLLQ